MANIKSAQKRIKVIQKKTARNKLIKDDMKKTIKAFERALEANDFDTAKEKLHSIEKKFDKAASKGVYHKAKASRKVSRLTKKLNRAV